MGPDLAALLARVMLLIFSASVPLYVITSTLTRVPTLGVPVSGVVPSALRDSFEELREGARSHRAIDIEAPEGTAVVAASGGVVQRISASSLGGKGVYLVDRDRGLCHYYGHLSRYAPSLEKGQFASRGEVLGFVGSTGNASSEAPHLHFAVFPLQSDGSCARDEPLNPYPLLTDAR